MRAGLSRNRIPCPIKKKKKKKKQVVCVLSPTHKSLPDYSDDCLIALSVSFSEKNISEIL